MRVLFPVRAGLGGNPVGAAVGVQGFLSVTNYLRSAVGQIMPGDVGGFFVSVALHVLAVPTAQSFFMTCDGVALKGWWFYSSTGVNRTFTVYNGAGAIVSSPVSNILVGDVGEILLFTGVYDPVAALARQYRAGVQVGAGTACVGYSPTTAAGRSALGSGGNGQQTSNTTRIVGALYGTGIPDAAAILAHYNACKAANTMESMGGAGVVNVNRWQAKDNLPAATNWADDIGGMNLVKTGTLNSVIFTPVWE